MTSTGELAGFLNLNHYRAHPPGKRVGVEAEDHCATCNPGYYISGTGCKVHLGPREFLGRRLFFCFFFELVEIRGGNGWQMIFDDFFR